MFSFSLSLQLLVLGKEQSEKKPYSAVLNLEVTTLLTNTEAHGIPVQILSGTNVPGYGVKNKLCG